MIWWHRNVSTHLARLRKCFFHRNLYEKSIDRWLARFNASTQKITRDYKEAQKTNKEAHDWLRFWNALLQEVQPSNTISGWNMPFWNAVNKQTNKKKTETRNIYPTLFTTELMHLPTITMNRSHFRNVNQFVSSS